MLWPVRKISETAEEICNGNDLKKRIDVGEGQDELHQLAAGFNGMFERLDQAFEMEKQFTSDASHELRTPVAVILAQCELMMGESIALCVYALTSGTEMFLRYTECGFSSSGRAPPCQGGGSEFEPRNPLHFFRHHSQAVRQRSAKPLFPGSIPGGASKTGSTFRSVAGFTFFHRKQLPGGSFSLTH